MFFFFNDPPPTEIYTLSLHDALPISRPLGAPRARREHPLLGVVARRHAALSDLRAQAVEEDRKSTRLNSSHVSISYAVFCLKKKNKTSEPHSACGRNGTGRTRLPIQT